MPLILSDSPTSSKAKVVMVERVIDRASAEKYSIYIVRRIFNGSISRTIDLIAR